MPRAAKPSRTSPINADTPWKSEAQGKLEYINRSMIVLRPRAPYVEWARQVAPYFYDDLTLARAREEDACAFLIPMGFGTVRESAEFVEHHWPRFFAQMLESFEHNPKKWPTNRTLAMFRQWFDIELCQPIIDVVETHDE